MTTANKFDNCKPKSKCSRDGSACSLCLFHCDSIVVLQSAHLSTLARESPARTYARGAQSREWHCALALREARSRQMLRMCICAENQAEHLIDKRRTIVRAKPDAKRTTKSPPRDALVNYNTAFAATDTSFAAEAIGVTRSASATRGSAISRFSAAHPRCSGCQAADSCKTNCAQAELQEFAKAHLPPLN